MLYILHAYRHAPLRRPFWFKLLPVSIFINYIELFSDVIIRIAQINFHTKSPYSSEVLYKARQGIRLTWSSALINSSVGVIQRFAVDDVRRMLGCAAKVRHCVQETYSIFLNLFTLKNMSHNWILQRRHLSKNVPINNLFNYDNHCSTGFHKVTKVAAPLLISWIL